MLKRNFHQLWDAAGKYYTIGNIYLRGLLGGSEMSVSEEIFEGFFSKSVDDNKIPKSLIDALQDYYTQGEEPTQEAIIKLISGAAQDAA